MIELKKVAFKITLLVFGVLSGFSAFSQYLPVEESVAKIEAAAEFIKWGSDSPLYVKQNKTLDYNDKLEALKLSVADQLISVIILENSSEIALSRFFTSLIANQSDTRRKELLAEAETFYRTLLEIEE